MLQGGLNASLLYLDFFSIATQVSFVLSLHIILCFGGLECCSIHTSTIQSMVMFLSDYSVGT